MVRYRDAMRVSAEILENMLRAAERSLAVDDPVLLEQLSHDRRESFRIAERLQLTVESDLAFGKGSFQSGSEFASEHPAEHLDGKEEGISRLDPALAIHRQSAGGNDTMDVRVMFHFLIPGMENAEEPDLGAEMRGIASDLHQGFSARTEQQAVDESFVLQCKWSQQARQREDNMHVPRRKEFLPTRLDPTLPRVGLALWTVPVPA